MDESPAAHPEIDFLLIADRAEAINGKLYMMGGAWDHITVPDLRAPISFSIAMGILIPWTATNEHHRMRIAVQDTEGHSLAELDGELVAGRPPHLDPGTQQRLLFATTFGVVLPRPGRYAVVVFLNEQESRRTGFTVVTPPPPAFAAPPLPPSGPTVA